MLDRQRARLPNGSYSVRESYPAMGTTSAVPDLLSGFASQGLGVNGISVSDRALSVIELDGAEFMPVDGWMVRSEPAQP